MEPIYFIRIFNIKQVKRNGFTLNLKIKVMESRETFLSLYDYLGKAAGPELGKKVAAAARKSRLSLKTRAVSNPTYAGFVYLYPKDFLDAFFGNTHPDDVPSLDGTHPYDTPDSDLPF